jgi:hypothetical protein
MTPCRILPNLGICFFFVLLSHLELTEFDPTAMGFQQPCHVGCPGTRGRRPTLSATREALLRVSREGGSLAFRGDLSAWEIFPFEQRHNTIYPVLNQNACTTVTTSKNGKGILKTPRNLREQ